MKKFYFAAALLSGVVTHAQILVDFEDLTLSGQQTFWNGSDGSGDFTSGDLTFSNVYNSSWGYWESGFAYSNQVSDTMTGLNGQYSSYADGGFGGSGIYAISQNNTSISGLASNNRVLHSIEVSNTNYAAHSMLNGDAFAKKFGGSTGDDPDWFLLTIYAYYETDTIPSDSLEVYLADYRFTDNTQDTIIKDWTQIDLSGFSFANADFPEKISFVLTSSDNGTWGMNTPAFFAIDHIQLSAIESVGENSLNFDLYPNPVSEQIYVSVERGNYDYQILSYEGRIIEQGRLLGEPINVSTLSTGSYLIRLIGEKATKTKKFIKY